MWVYNGSDSAVHLDQATRLFVTGSASSWGIAAQMESGTETVAANGTYGTQVAAANALTELLARVGWGPLP